MSQDIISDALNQVMNAKKAGKKNVVVKRFSNLMLKILDIMKKRKYISNYEKINGKELVIGIGELRECKTVSPRFDAKKDEIGKYVRRFLPARGIGIIIISTSKGIMTHNDAIEKNLGGKIIAYCF
jgi:small subunit ribosomal protein S15Ae